jgi:hypothetical protein
MGEQGNSRLRLANKALLAARSRRGGRRQRRLLFGAVKVVVQILDGRRRTGRGRKSEESLNVIVVLLALSAAERQGRRRRTRGRQHRNAKPGKTAVDRCRCAFLVRQVGFKARELGVGVGHRRVHSRLNFRKSGLAVEMVSVERRTPFFGLFQRFVEFQKDQNDLVGLPDNVSDGKQDSICAQTCLHLDNRLPRRCLSLLKLRGKLVFPRGKRADTGQDLGALGILLIKRCFCRNHTVEQRLHAGDVARQILLGRHNSARWLNTTIL